MPAHPEKRCDLGSCQNPAIPPKQLGTFRLYRDAPVRTCLQNFMQSVMPRLIIETKKVSKMRRLKKFISAKRARENPYKNETETDNLINK